MSSHYVGLSRYCLPRVPLAGLVSLGAENSDREIYRRSDINSDLLVFRTEVDIVERLDTVILK